MTMVPPGAVRPIVLSMILSLVASAAVAEDFYEQQLRIGKTDLAASRMVPASDELRIAAFGFLDRPPLLTEALARLAIAQSGLSQESAVTHTLTRFLDVERRFSVYNSAALEPQTRAAFEALLLKTVPHSEIASISGLAKLVRSEAAKVADLPPAKRAAAYEEGFRRSPKDIEWALSAARDAAGQGGDEETVRWSRRALAIHDDNTDARILLAHALTRRGECRDALAQISSLPASSIASSSQLLGDQLICDVKLSRWSDAETIASRLPDSERSRTDVARAVEALTARRSQPETKTAASKPAPASSAATNQRTTTTTTAAQAPPSSPAAVNKDKTPQTTAKTTAKPAASPGEILATARGLVAIGSYAEAARILQTASAADPNNRDLRLALLEAASLSRDWRTAVSQVAGATPFKSGEEASMFYAAAALYENGRKEDARPLMERARPRLPSIAIVEYYSKMILGPSPK
jgi:thioredoxin-like negative regulator of GroEL